jgi:hypothetical protein
MAKQGTIDLDPPPIDNALLSRITSLGVSTVEAEKIILKHSEEELLSNLEIVEDRLSKTSLPQIESPAAYLKTALKNQYGAARKTKGTVDKQKAKIAQEAIDQVKAKEEEEDSIRRSLSDGARDRFNDMVEDEQQALLDKFAETLKGPTLSSFRKSGLKTKLVSSTFTSWLVRELLADS